MAPVREQIADLKTQLLTEQERADRAEERLRDMQGKLEAEMVEHRRIVGMLTEQVAARRSWWPWRR